MSKYGNKFECWQCGTKYYDLGKPNPKCPKCGAEPSENPATGGAGTLEEEELGAEIEEFEEPALEEDEDTDEVEETADEEEF